MGGPGARALRGSRCRRAAGRHLGARLGEPVRRQDWQAAVCWRARGATGARRRRRGGSREDAQAVQPRDGAGQEPLELCRYHRRDRHAMTSSMVSHERVRRPAVCRLRPTSCGITTTARRASKQRVKIDSPPTCAIGNPRSHRSPSRSPMFPSLARADARNARRESTTPFGRPVVPDVKSTASHCSGSTVLALPACASCGPGAVELRLEHRRDKEPARPRDAVPTRSGAGAISSHRRAGSDISVDTTSSVARSLAPTKATGRSAPATSEPRDPRPACGELANVTETRSPTRSATRPALPAAASKTESVTPAPRKGVGRPSPGDEVATTLVASEVRQRDRGPRLEAARGRSRPLARDREPTASARCAARREPDRAVEEMRTP